MTPEASTEATGDLWMGVPRILDRDTAKRLVGGLDALWRAQGDAARFTSDSDIKKAWFDPLARGARLRAALDALPPAAAVVPNLAELTLAEPVVLNVGPDCLLVTLEGRAFATLLREQLVLAPSAARIRLRWSDTDAADAAVAAEYRRFVLSKLDSVVRLRSGSAAPLLPQAVGQVLLLLINGNLGPDRGLQRPESTADQRAVDEIVAALVSDFAERISPSKRGRKVGAYSLYGGYAMTEARRRLGSALSSNPVAIAPDSRDEVVERLITDLIRRGTTHSDAMEALEALISEYQKRRSQLALYGLAQGRPSDAAAVRRSFVERWDEIAAEHG